MLFGEDGKEKGVNYLCGVCVRMWWDTRYSNVSLC
jgi:hypothetical protein